MGEHDFQTVQPAGENITPTPVISAAVKGKIDELNQDFGEFVRAHKAELATVEASVGKLDPRLVAIEAKFGDAADTIKAMDIEIQALQKSVRPVAAEDGPICDPRNGSEWTAGFDSWVRNGPSAPVAAIQALDRGNHYANRRGKLKPEAVAAFDAEWEAWAQSGFDPKMAVVTGGLQSNFGPGAAVMARPHLEKEISRELVEYTPLRQFARVVNASGSPYKGVIRGTNRDTIEEPGEGAAPTQQTQDARYQEREITIHKFTASPALTTEQAEDSALDMEAELISDVILDFAVDESTKFTTGATATGPQGYAVDSAVGGVTSTTSSVLDHGDLTDLMLELRPLYRRNGVYALSTTALRSAMLEEDTFGRRLWQPSNTMGIPSLLNGYRFFESTELAAVASSAKPVFFADWMFFFRIIDRRGLRIVRNELTNPELIVINMSRRYGGRTWLTEAGKALTIA